MIKRLHLVGLTVAALAAPAWAGEDTERHDPDVRTAAVLSLRMRSPSLTAPLLALRTPSRPEPSSTWPIAPRAPGATRAAPVLRAPARETDDDELHVGAALTWAGIELAIPGWYYWHTKDEQKVDWADPSWADKLTLRAVRFDTNAFHVNAIRHPLAGTGDYQIARSNGFGMLGSTLFAYLAGAFWELCVEYREDPSANDLIMNGAGGLAIGEPFYQIGQLWRGSHPSLADRLRTAAFSPFAAAQDVWRPRRLQPPRLAWSDFAFRAGVVHHRLDAGGARDELAVAADIEAVRHAGYVTPGAHEGRLAPGAWSRIALGARLADRDGFQPVTTSARTRTSIAGVYRQRDDGDGALLAIGPQFTYRRERLETRSDHLAIAHLLGPQLQLSRRRGDLALRWDTSAYVDFGLVDAHVFAPGALPRPPPFFSTLQAQGYYSGGGASLETRLRADRGIWHAELELTAHQLYSLDFADRVPTPELSRTAETATPPLPPAPHGVSDLRAYGHAQLGLGDGRFGLAATLDAAYRLGRWRDRSHATSDWSVGLVATANL